MSVKRKAEEQLTPTIIENLKDDEFVDRTANNIETNENAKEISHPIPTGFLSYAKTNPFAEAITSSKGFANTESQIPVNIPSFSSFSSFSNTTNPFAILNDKIQPFSSLNPKGLTVETEATDNDVPPSLITPSPKSPKLNPFSSTSPKHNPFVKIVDSKDVAWLERTASNSSSNNFPSSKQTTSNNSIPTSKSFFTSFKDNNSNVNVDSKPVSSFAQWGSSIPKPNQSETKNDANDEDNDESNDNPEDEVEAPGPSFTKIYSLPENVVILTGEENEECILSLRAKLYRWVTKSSTNTTPESIPDKIETVGLQSSVAPLYSQPPTDELSHISGEWVEVGVGPLKILQSKIDSKSENKSDNKDITHKCRLVMRREEKKGGHGTKLLLNVALKGYITLSKQGEKAIRITCLNTDLDGKQPIPQTYVLKTKINEESDKLYEILEDCLNSARKSGY